MILLFLSILCTSALYMMFRRAALRNEDSRWLIVVNYATASLAAIILSLIAGEEWDGITSLHIVQALFTGASFSLVFLALSQLTKVSGATVSSVVSRMSLVIPVLYGILFRDERLNALGWIALPVALLAIAFMNKKSDGNSSQSVAFPLLLIILTFLGTGLADVIIKLLEERVIRESNRYAVISLAFMGAFLTMLGVAGTRAFQSKELPQIPYVSGVILGIFNVASLSLFYLAITATALPSSLLFPINNMGIVLFSTLGSIVLFKEHLQGRQWIGLGLALLSIILSTLSRLWST